MDWSRRDETERTLSAWRRFAPTVPVWGLFLMVFFSFRFELFVSRESISFFSLLRSFPMTGSSCSAHPVSFPNVVQRQPLLCPWPFKTIYSVKIAGPKHEVCMDELICPESVQRNGGAIRPWSLSAWRRFAPTVPVFGVLRKRLNPTSLPVLENTCPQPTSVKERLSPRMRSPWSKT